MEALSLSRRTQPREDGKPFHPRSLHISKKSKRDIQTIEKDIPEADSMSHRRGRREMPVTPSPLFSAAAMMAKYDAQLRWLKEKEKITEESLSPVHESSSEKDASHGARSKPTKTRVLRAKNAEKEGDRKDGDVSIGVGRKESVERRKKVSERRSISPLVSGLKVSSRRRLTSHRIQRPIERVHPSRRKERDVSFGDLEDQELLSESLIDGTRRITCGSTRSSVLLDDPFASQLMVGESQSSSFALVAECIDDEGEDFHSAIQSHKDMLTARTKREEMDPSERRRKRTSYHQPARQRADASPQMAVDGECMSHAHEVNVRDDATASEQKRLHDDAVANAVADAEFDETKTSKGKDLVDLSVDPCNLNGRVDEQMAALSQLVVQLEKEEQRIREKFEKEKSRHQPHDEHGRDLNAAQDRHRRTTAIDQSHSWNVRRIAVDIIERYRLDFERYRFQTVDALNTSELSIAGIMELIGDGLVQDILQEIASEFDEICDAVVNKVVHTELTDS
eukprot:TRINITY_DN74_c0_g3_i1.p1 TRINITY_DN74_c0_g3~~TRINITY_DN74_c0_g3_i1.p1  ORF type:complete len:543 (+),score=159.11 TRINITY_DN74_c0_g3_i1:106-1629(+)